MNKILLYTILTILSIKCYSQDSIVFILEDTTFTHGTPIVVDYGDSLYNYIDDELVYKEINKGDTTIAYSVFDGYSSYLWKSITYHKTEDIVTYKTTEMDKVNEIKVWAKNNTIHVKSEQIRVDRIRLHDTSGSLLLMKSPMMKEFNIDTEYNGIIIVNIETLEGTKVVKVLMGNKF